MKETDILTSSSMPIASPSYPKGPYRFIDREFMIITYKSDPDAIRNALPEPLEPDGSDTVLYEFIKMPNSAGFGDYTESGVIIPHYICDPRMIAEKISGPQVNLKLIPDIDGSIAIAQLVAYNLIDIHVKGAWSGNARLQLHAQVNAPVADLPVGKTLRGLHFIADLTLPYGRVRYDYKRGHEYRREPKRSCC